MVNAGAAGVGVVGTAGVEAGGGGEAVVVDAEVAAGATVGEKTGAAAVGAVAGARCDGAVVAGAAAGSRGGGVVVAGVGVVGAVAGATDGIVVGGAATGSRDGGAAGAGVGAAGVEAVVARDGEAEAAVGDDAARKKPGGEEGHEAELPGPELGRAGGEAREPRECGPAAP